MAQPLLVMILAMNNPRAVAVHEQRLWVAGPSGLFRREEATAVGKLFVWLYEKGFWKDYKGKVETSRSG